MLFGEYNFKGVLEDDAVLPPFKGSTFRGVFGRALKEVTCALKRQECPTCLLRSQCVYTQVFEFPPDRQTKGTPSPPHPFVIEPPLDFRTNLPRGEHFDFALLLFGTANQFLPYFVYAFEEMGRIGIGKRLQGRRAQFRLVSVTTSLGETYNAEERTLSPKRVGELNLENFVSEDEPVKSLEISLITPLRLKFQNQLQAELPFHVLVRAILRRIATLNAHFGNGEPRLDYKGLVARAHQVQTLKSSLYWFDWQRYSHRQDQAMLLGGIVGEVTFGGDLGEFLPLLRHAEKVHLGKATSFGLGKIKVSIPSRNAGRL